MAFQRFSVHRPISTPRERSGGKEKNEQLCSLRSQLRRNLRSAAEFAAAVSATAESKLNVRRTAQNAKKSAVVVREAAECFGLTARPSCSSVAQKVVLFRFWIHTVLMSI